MRARSCLYNLLRCETLLFPRCSSTACLNQPTYQYSWSNASRRRNQIERAVRSANTETTILSGGKRKQTTTVRENLARMHTTRFVIDIKSTRQQPAKTLNEIHNWYSEVFYDELGHIQNFTAKLLVRDETRPSFARPDWSYMRWKLM